MSPLPQGGFEAIRYRVQVRGEIAPRDLARLQEAAERFCVVLSTLRQPPAIEVAWEHEAVAARDEV